MTSCGNCISAVLVTLLQILSTKMPALIACATERNFGFSSDFRFAVASCRVKVEASHSRTSGGTASGWTSDSSSSSSANLLHTTQHPISSEKQMNIKLKLRIHFNQRNLPGGKYMSLFPLFAPFTTESCEADWTLFILTLQS